MKILELFRKLVLSMNFLIAGAMGYGLCLFFSQDGMFDGWSWLYYLPIYLLIFIGLPILMCISLFRDSSIILKSIFLTLNILAMIALIGGLFVDSWVMSSDELPFSWRSYTKISLIVASPFIANTLTLSLLLFQKSKTQRP